MNTQAVLRFHPVLVALHWGLGALIIADLAIGTFVLVHIPNDSPMKIEALRAHTTAGIAILTLVLLRLAVRAGTAKPADVSTGNAFLDRVAWLSHRLLYVAILGLAGSGLLMGLQAHVPQAVFFGHGRLPASFWDYSLRGIHYFFARSLIALIALHVAGALYHTFVLRDGLLRRMWFGRRRADAGAAAGANRDPRTFWHYAPYLERVILAVPTMLFVLIGWKYLGEPLRTAAGSGTVLGSPAAITDTRAMGAVFLALAALTLFALLSRRLLTGLVLVAAIDGFVLMARLLGVVADGAVSETMFKLVAEVVLLALTAAGILLELERQRRLQGAMPGRRSVLASE
jgi:cytochrome b561